MDRHLFRRWLFLTLMLFIVIVFFDTQLRFFYEGF